MKNILMVFLPLFILFASCTKSDLPALKPESSKELMIINQDSSKFGGYVNCGIAGKVDGTGLYFQFIASSIEGEVTITNLKYRINVNDGSKPFTMFTMYDGYSNAPRDILVTGNEVEFTNMKCVIPEGDNGRYSGVGLTYSGIGRNGVVSGRTVSSVTLISVTYVDRYGHSKTVNPNLKSPDRMSTYSYMWLNPQYYQNTMNGLSIGQNRVFWQAFSSHGGDHLLKEVPLRIKTVDCSIGTVPQVSVMMYDGGPYTGPYPILPANVTRINDSTIIVKLPQPLLVKKESMASVTFFVDVQSMTITPNTKLRTSLGNLKYLKYTEVATGIEFLAQNEQFMWMTYYYSPWNIDDYYLELYP